MHMHMHTHIHAYLSGRHAQEGVVASDDELGPPGQEKDNQHSIKVSTMDGEGDSSTTWCIVCGMQYVQVYVHVVM